MWEAQNWHAYWTSSPTTEVSLVVRLVMLTLRECHGTISYTASGSWQSRAPGSGGTPPFLTLLHPIIMTLTTISDEVREGRMINFDFSLWILRKWNDRLYVNKEIPDVWDL